MKKIYMLVTACLMSLTLTNCDDFWTIVQQRLLMRIKLFRS